MGQNIDQMDHPSMVQNCDIEGNVQTFGCFVASQNK